MCINRLFYLLVAGALLPLPASAGVGHDEPTIFHYSRLEADTGSAHGDTVSRWDLDAWYGGDANKFWVKSEGEVRRGTAERAQVWGLYSRNIGDFWDVQAGVREDVEPGGTTYLALGFEGLAPYYFETEAHVFVSQRGDLSARFKERNDLLITQRLIAQPYLEARFYTQDDPREEVGRGVAGEVGLQTRYEFTRQFAPYVDVRYEANFGGAGRAAERSGEYRSSLVASVGLRLMY